MVQGLSRTLFEEVRFDRDSVKSVDWASYPILEMGDAPESIDITLIDRPEVAPSGAGEPTHPRASRRRWPTPSSTRPACACAARRSARSA